MGDVLRRRKMNNRRRGVILKEASFMTSGQSLIDNIGHQSRQNNRVPDADAVGGDEDEAAVGALLGPREGGDLGLRQLLLGREDEPLLLVQLQLPQLLDDLGRVGALGLLRVVEGSLVKIGETLECGNPTKYASTR